jgi:hypothetical protein
LTYCFNRGQTKVEKVNYNTVKIWKTTLLGSTQSQKQKMKSK